MRWPELARSADLAATIGATLLAVVVALLSGGGPLATVALLPLVLVLPGYALTAALFPLGTIGRDLRLVLIAALSIGATALGGLVLSLFVVLSRGAFVATLSTLTIAAALAAWHRRETQFEEPDPTLALPRIPLAPLAVLAAAVVLAGVAIAIASAGANRQLGAARFSALWLVPKGPPGTPPNGPPVIVGVANREGRETGYLLTLTHSGETVRAWRLRLAPGQEWEAALGSPAVSGGGPLVARLDRAGKLYRRVALELGSRPQGGSNG